MGVFKSIFVRLCFIFITLSHRFLFANFTSSLLIVNSTLLAFAALALLGLGGLYSVFIGIMGRFLIFFYICSALAYLFYFLTTVSYWFYALLGGKKGNHPKPKLRL